jgi:hypothetical protein
MRKKIGLYYKEKFMKSHQVNLFLVGFSQLEPQCAAARAAASMRRSTSELNTLTTGVQE